MTADGVAHRIVLNFNRARASSGEDIAAASSGEDIAALITAADLPDADITATFDDRGAVTGYQLILHFDDPERTVDVAFRLRDVLTGLNVPFRVE